MRPEPATLMNTHRFTAAGRLTNYEMRAWRKAHEQGHKLHWGFLWGTLACPQHFDSLEAFQAYRRGEDSPC
jgi:hypothetical protein